MNDGAGVKRRKRRRSSIVDDSQKSIDSFCFWFQARKDTTSEGDTNAVGLGAMASRSESKVFEATSTVPRKKQTLLAPFHEMDSPNSFRVKKVDRWNLGQDKPNEMDDSKSINCQVEREGNNSDSDIIECCEKVELSLSQEKMKQGDDNGMSSTCKDGFAQSENINVGWSNNEENELDSDIIECCERVELSFSPDKCKNKNDHIRSSNFGKAKINKYLSNSDGKERELNVIGKFKTSSQHKSMQNDLPDTKKSSNSCNSGNMFGLFGSTSSDDETLDLCYDAEMYEYEHRSCLNDVPDEILENIFCQLPLIDLLTNLSVVCKRWNAIISNEKFLPWKKRYYRYKHLFESRKRINDFIIEDQLHVPLVFPLQLCRFLSKFRVRHQDHSNLYDVLRCHSKFHLVEKFLQQNDAQQFISPWPVIGLLSLVSSSVYDIQEIIKCLLRSSTCLLYDILECLHCLALIFFVLMDKHTDQFSSHHYRIYYALYLLENSSHCTQSSLKSAYSANRSGQQSILKYRETSDSTWLTHEQVRIMNHNTKHGDVLKIIAFAGTGKTTTLIEYTKLRPSWRFLNVAYNKSVQEQAVRKFPTNVESRTVHSLAYRAFGFKYRGKMASSIRVSNILDNLSKKSANFLHAKRVADTLENFICSYDDAISSEHVPYCEITSQDTDGDRNKLEFFNSDAYRKIVVKDSKGIWEKMCSLEDRDVRITHDGYLKIYQLSKPIIQGYDCILVDEAQDCTPAVADILLSQPVAKILVGDPHQQIYGFRGATNAMAQVDATHVYYLTQSFRFGSEIASVASSLLDVLKGVRDKNIVGVAKPGGFHGDHLGQIAVICRTNFTVFNNAVHVCTSNNKTRIGFAGGIQGYNLDRILDIHKLYSGAGHDGIKDKFIKRFRTFAELSTYARKAPDPELCGKIKIVATHNVNIPGHVERIKRQNCTDIDQAEIVFSTAHKAKGLEFDTVRLGEDFLQDRPLGELAEVAPDEKNLLYVAVTRAKHRLQCSSILYSILSAKTDLLVTCENINVVENIQSTYCVECKRLCNFDQALVVMKRAQVSLATQQTMDGGYLCSKCVSRCIPLMANLLGTK